MMPSNQPIPEGYHTVTPLLVVTDPAKALDFYKRAFGAKEVLRMEIPGTGRIGHAELLIGDSRLMLGDETPERQFIAPEHLKAISSGMYLYVKDADGLYRRAIEAGAREVMPMRDMFWGDRCGQIRDPFGHIWTLATHKEDLSFQEIQERARQFYTKAGSA